MKAPKYILILFLGFYSFAFTQSQTSFDKEIAELNILGTQIISNKSDEDKYIVNKKYKSALKELISNNQSFDFNFDSLKTISILQAKNLKIYNWTIPLIDGTYKYFAFLQIRKDKNNYKVIELFDKSDQIKTPENKILTTKNWYGALYYEIIHNKTLGKKFYTLLGWDGNNNLTNKKIIDVIYISENGIIKFGAPIFKTKKKTKKRVIFEYSEDAVMSLKYHENLGKIVFDYLVPASSKLKGVYEYYGPSLDTFDAFLLENNKWLYEKNTEIKLDRNIKDNFWKKPEKAIIH